MQARCCAPRATRRRRCFSPPTSCGRVAASSADPTPLSRRCACSTRTGTSSATDTGRAVRHPGWACYHTELWTFDLDGTEVGVIGCAVGASFAVLIAEQLFVSGCELLVSVSSSGMITPLAEAPYFIIIIDRALRDEGTSHHYLPPGDWAAAPQRLLDRLDGRIDGLDQGVVTGSTWTTDAPYRETEQAIADARSRGIAAVEMEAAALYAFAAAQQRDVMCFAHVTNTMATDGDDFEKGDPPVGRWFALRREAPA